MRNQPIPFAAACALRHHHTPPPHIRVRRARDAGMLSQMGALSEVEVLRNLDHPNLVKLFEVIDDPNSDKLLMVMEYVEGGAIMSLESSWSVVNPLPDAGVLSGPTAVCERSTISLASTVSGGTWSSSDATTATISSTGDVTGVAAGTVTISYTYTNVCGSDTSYYTVTVNPLPVVSAITGTTTVCEASTTTLADATTGGTWTSDATGTAAIDAATGLVTGISAGTATISYAVTNGFSCTDYATTLVTVNPLPHAGTLSGTPVCELATTSYSSTTPGGDWSISDTATATIDAVTGVVTGVHAGTATITYIYTNSCGSDTATTTLTVNPLPVSGSISGTDSVCEGSSVTLAASLPTGAWTSGSVAIASVDGTTGEVFGLSAGTVTISYSITNVCGTADSLFAFTVLPLPHAGTLTGADSICLNATTTISSTVSGGYWYSSNTSIATIDSVSGSVTGTGIGTTTISYVYTNSCGSDVSTRNLLIKPLPFAGTISGLDTVCEGSTTTLTSSVSGGTWSSAIPAIATVDPSTGVVFGAVPGNTSIHYTVTNFCGTHDTSLIVVVRPLPHSGGITGATSVCATNTIGLIAGFPGGSWTASPTTIATVDATSGVVTGVNAGTATITYGFTNSCGTDTAMHTVTVLALPDAGTISGSDSVCEGSRVNYSSTTTGGTWSTSSATIASVNPSTGRVFGTAAGIATISYIYTNSCGSDTATKSIIVNPLPLAGTIRGTAFAACVGDTIHLSIQAIPRETE
ncbi:MAG: hypothetical protein EBZ77_10865 [Chitinophagia bacterium]|nr:hypothetical protein [Chitinophagia bacterium]